IWFLGLLYHVSPVARKVMLGGRMQVLAVIPDPGARLRFLGMIILRATDFHRVKFPIQYRPIRLRIRRVLVHHSTGLFRAVLVTHSISSLECPVCMGLLEISTVTCLKFMRLGLTA